MLAIAAFVLSFNATASADTGCVAAYKSDYAARWDISEKEWAADCASGRDAAEALRLRQQAFIRACADRFSDAVKSGKAHSATVEAYCAQGADGRRRLNEQFGRPEESPATPSPPTTRASEWRPETDGMGPMATAIKTAKRVWGAGSCLFRFAHAVDIAEVCRGEQCPLETVESYAYDFAFDDPKTHEPFESTILYQDALRDNSCFFRESLVPDIGSRSGSKGRTCLRKVEIDLAQAMRIADKGGLAVKGKSRAVLAPGRHFDVLLRTRYTRECRFSERQLRRVRDRDAWLIWADGKALVIDSASGETLFRLLLDELCIPAEATRLVQAGCFH